ncbi:MAG TPA: muconate cycloisomerase family protein [Pseudonocardiaceae bacterium]|nr:muconate cycloisomerase family protein [Pseudonocardiaceae bacterium]
MTGGTSIQSIGTTLVDVPLRRPHRVATQSIAAQSMVLVRVRTSDGVEGIGEAVVPGGPWWGGESVEGMQALIDRYLAPLLHGQDARRVGYLAHSLDRAIGGGQFAKAGVEMALWDALGKYHGVPLYDLLGGLHRDAVPVTWALGADPVAEVVAEARARQASHGHTSFKLKMGAGDPAADVARVTHIAAELADQASVRVDLNGSWDELTARRLLPALQDAGIDMVEQPVAAWNLAALADLTGRLTIPIMADESLRGPHDASTLIRQRAADVFAVKLAKLGGVAALRDTVAVAQTAGVPCHGGTTIESSIGTAAAAHVYCATGGVTAGSELFGPLLLADDLVKDPVRYESGQVSPPSGPGLGVTLDEEQVARYTRR